LGLFGGIKAFFTERRAKPDYGNFEKWFVPHNIFFRKSEGALANNEIIFAAITKLSNAIASLPVKLYKDFLPQYGHRLQQIIGAEPNEYMTSFGFFQTVEVLRNVYGNAYAMKRYDGKYSVVALDLIDPSKVEPMLEETSKELYYRINAPAGVYYVHSADMVHVRHITTRIKGISPIDVLRNTINFDDKIRTFSLDQMDTSIKAKFILKMAASLSREKRAEQKKEFEDFYSKNGSVIIIDSGSALEQIKMDLIDPKLFEIERITKARVALVFNLPLYKMGEGNELGNEQQEIAFLTDTILPIVRQYEQELDKKLLTAEEKRQGYALKLNMGGRLRADTKTRGEFYFKGVRSGFLKPNEIRAWEDLPPETGGDKLYMSRDLQPIDDAAKQGEGVNE